MSYQCLLALERKLEDLVERIIEEGTAQTGVALV